MHEQRLKIERDYIAAIKKWSSTWQKDVSHSAEFGTNKKTWIASIRAGEQSAKTHTDIVGRIQHDVIDKMINYKKEHYGKSILHVKKVKDFTKDFENVQKPWVKLLGKINDAKKSYHETRKKLKKAESAQKIIESDSGASDEQKSKAKLSVESYNKEVTTLRNKYQQLMDEMTNTRQNYENSMKEVLDRTHEFERKRLSHFKVLFNAFHDAIHIEKDPNLTEMSTTFKKALTEHNVEADIQWWNANYGSDTNTSWPVFEDLKD